ncbi:MAG: hypothetical protein ACI9CF_001590 [Candidatus Omnitrophota bacterium]|jgi:hypothetical protein
MKYSNTTQQDCSNWRLASVLLGLVYVAFYWMQWPGLPRFLDMAYHLNVVHWFHQIGGYTTFDFWSYAPGGRPHLYAPLLHTGMLTLKTLGMADMALARLTEVTIYSALIITYTRFVVMLFSWRVAFFTLLLMLAFFPLQVFVATLPAFTLAFIMTLNLFMSINSARFVKAALFLALSIYAHTAMGLMSALACFVYLVFDSRGQRIQLLKVIIAGLIMAAPLLIWIGLNLSYMGVAHPLENRILEIDPLIWGLLPLGLMIAQFKSNSIKILSALFMAMLPMALSHNARFVAGHHLLIVICFSALGIECLWNKIGALRNSRSIAILTMLILIGCHLCFPTIQYNTNPKKLNIFTQDRSLWHLLAAGEVPQIRGNETSIYFESHYDAAIKIIREQSPNLGTIWCNYNYMGGLLATLSSRLISNAMLAEVKPFEITQKANTLNQTNLAIWVNEPNGTAPAHMQRIMEINDFVFAGKTDMATFYKNKHELPAPQLPKPLIPTPYLMIFLFIVFAVICVPTKGLTENMH